MDRSLSSHSLDNVLDNLISKAAHFPRTDSEDQFRKFLERIPSASNLANQQGGMQSLPQAQQEHLQQQMASLQQHSLLASTSGPLSTQLPEGGSLNVGGIPRVPSLDLLRQIVNQQQQQQQQQQQASSSKPLLMSANPVKDEPEAAMGFTEPVTRPTPVRLGSDAGRASAELMASSTAGPTALSLPMASLAQPMPSQVPVAAAAAAALQLSNLQSLQPKKSPARGRDTKAEVRRERRMLSNRESARRSRRRKQEHLNVLEEQISALEDEREQLQSRVEKLERQAVTLNDQNKTLKRENEDMRQQLGIEGKEGRPNKRMCNGH